MARCNPALVFLVPGFTCIIYLPPRRVDYSLKSPLSLKFHSVCIIPFYQRDFLPSESGRNNIIAACHGSNRAISFTGQTKFSGCYDGRGVVAQMEILCSVFISRLSFFLCALCDVLWTVAGVLEMCQSG